MFEKVRTAAIALAICLAGGATFFLIHVPLPWMLGSLTASAIAAIAGRRWFIPLAARGAARPVVGVLAGGSFTGDVVASIPQWWDSILIVVAQVLVITLLGFVFYRKVGGYNRQTAFFAGAPGGLAELSLLGASLGGNVRSIAIGQTLRIMVLVVSMPFILQWIVGHPIGRTLPTSPVDSPPQLFDWMTLAICAVVGYGLARLFRLSAGLVIFPMLLSAAVHAAGLTQAVPPPWLVALVQVIVGGIVGARFAGIDWREMRIALVLAAAWAVAMVAFTAVSAYAASLVAGPSFIAMVLALAPGGMVEMTILTYSVGIEVAFVVTCQVFRILCVLVFVPVLFRLMTGLRARPGPPTRTT